MSAESLGPAALGAAGMSLGEAAAKASLFGRAARALETLEGAPPGALRAWFVPGRLEVLGKHTDYAGGRSLLCAIERGCAFVASPRADSRVRLVDAVDQSIVSLAISPDLRPAADRWAIYPMTVARRIARNFPGARCGADIALASDLPQAAGMSSSSALMVGVFLVLADLNGLESHDAYRREIRSREDLAAYLATIENGHDFWSLAGDAGVGTFGGSEDHTAILCAAPGRLRQYAFCPVRHERTLAIDPYYVFAIAASGVAARKTGEALGRYNHAAALARQVLTCWQKETGRDDPSLAAAAASAADAPDRIRGLLARSIDDPVASAQLVDRFEQFLEESERIVPAVADLLASGVVERIGGLVDRSQELAERLLGNQIPETIELTRSARALGALASSAFGAGFGGSVWALIRSADADAFVDRWKDAYRTRFPGAAARATFFTTRPGPPALRVF